MNKIFKISEHREEITVEPCPFCGRRVTVGDSGYSAFNPAWARCVGSGSCGRKWSLGYVDPGGNARALIAERWNEYRVDAIEHERLAKRIHTIRHKMKGAE